MKLKKTLALLLSAVMLASTAGCGGTASQSQAPASSAKESAPASSEAAKFDVMGDSLKYDPNVPVNNGEEVTLKIWVPAAWESFYKKWTEDYRRYHPNVKFEFTITSFDDHWKKVPLAIQGKTGPDLFWMHNDATQIMTPHMEPLPEEQFPMEQLKADFLQVESNVIDGKLYYTDLGLMTGVIFYNKDMWEKAGLTEADTCKTWDDLIKTAEKLTQRDSAGNIQVAGFNTNNAEYIWVDMLYQQGKWLFAEDNTTVMFNSPEAEKAAQLMYDMYHTYGIGSGTQPKGEEAFANGKAAMIYCWGWASNYFKSNFPDLNYGAFALPTFTGSDVAYGRNNGDVTLGVSKYSDAAKKEAALNFVNYELCNDDMIIEFDVFDGMSPTKKSLASRPEIMEEPVLKVQSEMLAKTVWPGPVPGNCFSDIQKYIGQSILVNKTAPKDALAEAQQMVNEGMKGKDFVSVEKKSALADKFTSQ